MQRHLLAEDHHQQHHGDNQHPPTVVSNDEESFQLWTREGTFTISPQYSWYEPLAELEVNHSCSKTWKKYSGIMNNKNSAVDHNSQVVNLAGFGGGQRSRWAQRRSVAIMIFYHVVMIALFMVLFIGLKINPNNMFRE